MFDNFLVTIPVDIAGLSNNFFSARIRLYSTKSLKPLGTLNYHKGSCQAVVFSRSLHHAIPSAGVRGESTLSQDEEDDDEDEMNKAEKMERTRWLVGGGKDHRVSIWALMSFNNSST